MCTETHNDDNGVIDGNSVETDEHKKGTTIESYDDNYSNKF